MKKKTTKFIVAALMAFSGLPSFATILPPNNNPVVENPDDHLVVVRNNSVIFDSVKKDKTASQQEVSGIVSQPEFGTVTINDKETLTYVPNEGVCEESDSFSYLLSTDKGTDTVDVVVDILCESLTIISGFSPNGDGINDTFTILGIENYPNNILTIFNQWGEQVYFRRGYQNDWNGNQFASEDLYFYVFNDGEGQFYSGYLQIQN